MQALTYPLLNPPVWPKTRGLSPRPHRRGTQRRVWSDPGREIEIDDCYRDKNRRKLVNPTVW